MILIWKGWSTWHNNVSLNDRSNILAAGLSEYMEKVEICSQILLDDKLTLLQSGGQIRPHHIGLFPLDLKVFLWAWAGRLSSFIPFRTHAAIPRPRSTIYYTKWAANKNRVRQKKRLKKIKAFLLRKVEKVLKGSLDSIPSPSLSVKI